MPVSTSSVKQLRLDPGQPQVGHVAALTGAAPAEQAGLVAEHRDHDVGGPGALERGRQAGTVVAADVAAGRVLHPGLAAVPAAAR